VPIGTKANFGRCASFGTQRALATRYRHPTLLWIIAAVA
jgi:hypothetical protein